LLINDNAVGSPQTAALTGTGVAVLTSIAVSPATATIGVGGTQQFAATGSYNDGSQKDITASASWSSTKTSVATVSNTNPTKGQATGVAAGSATLRATTSGITGSASLTVTSGGKLNQTITFTGTPAAAIYNTSFTVSASASSGLTVTITSSGVCTLSGNTVTMTSGTGTCTLTASQAGNATYNAAPNVTNNVSAQKAAATLTLGNLAQTYDGNGNVAALVDASSGAIAASYEYSPFGELLRSESD